MGFKIEQFEQQEGWLAARKTGLGGTDTAAIMGESKWKGRHDVWMDKVGMAPEKECSERMEWGNILEPVIAARWRERNQIKFRDLAKALLRHEKYSFLCCSPDRLVYPDSLKSGLEIKNVGMWSAQFWGEEGTDEIPADYLLQVQKCLLVTGYDVWHVAVLIGGQEYREYCVEPDKELHEIITEEEVDFWEKYVQKKREPPIDPSESCTRFLNRKYPKNNGDLLEIESPEIWEVLEEYRFARAKAKTYEAEAESLTNKIRDIIGLSDGVSWKGNKITWKLAKGSISWKGLAEHLLESVEPKERSSLRQRFTGEGSRRFTVKFKEEEESNGSKE